MSEGRGHTKVTSARASKDEPPITAETVIRKRQERIEQKRTIIDFFAKLVLVALALWVIFTFLFGIDIMEGVAMYPSLRDGDMYLYYRLDDEYHIGDVVTFTTSEGKQYVGRVVARGGDTVDMSDLGQLLINGNAQDEEIFYPTYKTDSLTDFPCTLQDTQVFLLCDFRTEGTDSRTYGAVQTDNLDGKIIAVLRRRGI